MIATQSHGCAELITAEPIRCGQLCLLRPGSPLEVNTYAAPVGELNGATTTSVFPCNATAVPKEIFELLSVNWSGEKIRCRRDHSVPVRTHTSATPL